ncbi:MAG: bifunctional folylpolyglutamate synthase/dihydrofolate synthase [Candidatus Binatia bacterium]
MLRVGKDMDAYGDTVAWLYALDSRVGMDFGLERLKAVLDELDNPERTFPSVHVAGTNGKGSTAAVLHSIYSKAGYRTGLYTSPHLVDLRERIRVDGGAIDEESVVEWTGLIRSAARVRGCHLTFFEILTVMAFLWFRRQEVDLAIVEVGLGGRLDATNVVHSVASVITSVGLDHCAWLGSSIAAVASEKAGILKPGVPLVSGRLEIEAESVISESVNRLNCPWLCFGRDFGPCEIGSSSSRAPGLNGDIQRHNAAVAVAVVRQLGDDFPVSDQALGEGVAASRWPGRLELREGEPRVVLDVAHNPQAVRILVEELPSLCFSPPMVLVFGVMADKDWQEMLCSLLPLFDSVVLVPVRQRRSLDPSEALPLVEGLRGCRVADSSEAGFEIARELAGAGGSVVVTGSVFLVGELYSRVLGTDDPFWHWRKHA